MDDWEKLYRTHMGELFQFLLYMTGNREEAKDLTQDTFIKVHEKYSQYRNDSSVRTWIFAIARNLAMDRLRKRQSTSRLHEKLVNNVTLHAEGPEGPDVRFSMNEQNRELYAAIQSLKVKNRCVVILRGIQEYSVKETADILGWTQNRVNVMYHRSLKQLQKLLSERRVNYEVDAG